MDRGAYEKGEQGQKLWDERVGLTYPKRTGKKKREL